MCSFDTQLHDSNSFLSSATSRINMLTLCERVIPLKSNKVIKLADIVT